MLHYFCLCLLSRDDSSLSTCGSGKDWVACCRAGQDCMRILWQSWLCWPNWTTLEVLAIPVVLYKCSLQLCCIVVLLGCAVQLWPVARTVSGSGDSDTILRGTALQGGEVGGRHHRNMGNWPGPTFSVGTESWVGPDISLDCLCLSVLTPPLCQIHLFDSPPHYIALTYEPILLFQNSLQVRMY